MKVAVVLLVCIAVTLAAALNGRSAGLVNDDFVASLNQIVDMKWTASTKQGARIEGATTEQIAALCGVKRHVKQLPRKVFSDADLSLTLPDSFDAKDKWPQCPTITHIRDQSACGSCWAVAAAESISDRYCTLGNITDRLISAANIMDCCWWCGSGCQGGDPSSAWSDWTVTGLTLDSCQPYPFPKCEHHIPVKNHPECPKTAYQTPSCSYSCSANSTDKYKLYKGATSYSLSGVSEFKTELYTNGPFEVAFDVYADFPAYKGGVYVQKSNQYLGGHAVKVVGWGTLNGTDYWKIANSWNRDWGLDGYFLIERGVDMCGIENSGSAGTP